LTIHFINRFYRPDEPATAQLLGDLAEALAARGRAVRVIASRPPGAPPAEVLRGVRIARVGSARPPEGGLAAKAVNFAAFGAAALARLARGLRAGDVAVVMTDPPLLGLGVAALARARRARCVHWIQDIYPEVALAVGGPAPLGWVRPGRNCAWRAASGCVVPGRDMGAVVAAAGVDPERIRVIPNWPPAGLAPPAPERIAARRRAWGWEGRFVAAYSGNLGRVHDLAPILDAAGALRDDPNLIFAFIGGGAQRAAIEAEARRHSLAQVRFFPAQPRAELAESLAAADVHVASLRAGCERYVFPSKIYGAAAVGRPVLFFGPAGCEPARVIEEHGFGRAFAPGGAEAAAACLRAWGADPAERTRLGEAALRFAAAGGGWLGSWEDILDSGK
jgi:glycosyltransferase involved in cell wall biosynthesis